MKPSKTNSGILNFFEKIVRSHPLLYFVIRYFIRFTNIFEQDANGVSYINLSQKINILDVGASDGIATKFFSRKLNVNKICLFTPYSKKLNDEVLEYFKEEGFEVTSNSYFDIEADYDIGKVDQNYLFNVLSEIDLNGAEALFVSCTALPVLPIIDKLEKKLNTTVLSSNQALIWDTLVKINKNNSVEGFGKLFKEN